MEHIVAENNLGWSVDSAGTGDWHVGQAPDKRSVAVAQQYGVDISSQRAQHFTAELFDRYDRIFVMDRQNMKDVLGLARTDEDRAKVSLFLEGDVVPDPYYDDTLFEPVYAMVEARCHDLIKVLSL
jgi:protein-tyrosine phosphatase